MATCSTTDRKIEVNCSSDNGKGGCHCKCHRVPVTLRDHFWRDPFFSSNWEDFDKIRQQMIEESKQMWSKFDDDFKDMTNSSSLSSSSTLRTSSKSDHLSSSNGEKEKSLWPNRFSHHIPSVFSDFGDIPSSSFITKDDQIIKVKNDDKGLEVSLDTHHFRPDELKVNVHNNVLSVEAQHEEKSDDGVSRYVSRQFVRKYTLPEGCIPEQVTSNLSSDGVLIINAPKKTSGAITESGRSVPITMKN